MKLFFFTALVLWSTGICFPQEKTAPVLPPAAGPGPSADWFPKNAVVTDKKEYVHFFFNAQDYRKNFEGKDQSIMLAKTAAEMVALLYPPAATADKIKMDFVYVTQRDAYGMPNWDSLVWLAHLEFSKKAVLKDGKPKKDFTESEIQKIFLPFQVF